MPPPDSIIGRNRLALRCQSSNKKTKRRVDRQMMTPPNACAKAGAEQMKLDPGCTRK